MKYLPDGRVEIECIMSRVYCEPTARLENGDIVLGGRSIEVFPNGRTELREFDNARIRWDDGSPMKESDLRRFR